MSAWKRHLRAAVREGWIIKSSMTDTDQLLIVCPLEASNKSSRGRFKADRSYIYVLTHQIAKCLDFYPTKCIES